MLRTALLLTISNAFMTFAWYGHLRGFLLIAAGATLIYGPWSEAGSPLADVPHAHQAGDRSAPARDAP